jgi:hypothetical protein
MTRLLRLAALCIAASLPSGAALAAKSLKPGVVKLDPALGYVMVRIGPTVGKKFRSSPLYLWRFDPLTSEVRTKRKKDPARVPKIEDDSVSLGDRVFVAGERTSVFLSSITPGDWVIHGSVKTCLCLGSYRFTVKPGEITDLGTVLIQSEAGGIDVPELRLESMSMDLLERPYAVPEAIFVKAAAEGDMVPAEVKDLVIKRAELVSDVRFANRAGLRYLYYGGLLVNRAVGLPKMASGDGKALVEAVERKSGDTEVVAKPVLQGEEPKPTPDAEPVPAAPAAP